MTAARKSGYGQPAVANAGRYRHSAGVRAGSIIALVSASHIPRKEPAASGHDWPHIGSQTPDIHQPPAIGTSPIAAIASLWAIVMPVAVPKNRARIPRKTAPGRGAKAAPRPSPLPKPPSIAVTRRPAGC